MASIKRTILYYPTINVPSNSWLRHALLYWDEVSSIVPQSWDEKLLYELSDDIHYLIDNGQFRPIKPEDLIFKADNFEVFEDFQKEFQQIVESDQFKKLISRSPYLHSRIHINKVSKHQIAHIHRNKTSDNLIHFLEDKGLAARYNSDWLKFERHTALLYMSLLAKYLANIDKNQTTIGTDHGIYEKFNFRRVKPGEGFPVISLNICNVLPTPRANVPLEKILDFKRARKDNLLHFRKTLMDFHGKVSKTKSNQELKDLCISFQDNLKLGVKDLTKAMKDSKLEILFRSLKSLINAKSTWFATGAIMADQKLNLINAPLSIKAAGLATAGLIELSSNYIELRNKQDSKIRESSFSYIYHAQKAGILKP